MDPRVQRAHDALRPFLLTWNEVNALFRDDAVFGGAEDFRIPTMPQGRGRSSKGGISFHFKMDSVSREAVPLLNGKPYRRGGAPAGTAGGFEAYLRRDDAAEVVQLTYLRYMSREGADERLIGIGGDADDSFPSVISNISDIPAEREDYWRKVWDRLRPPKTNYLAAFPERSPAFWDALDQQTALPPKLRDHLLRVRAAYRDLKSNPDTRFDKLKCEVLAVTADEAGEYLASVHQLGERLQPVTFISGRSPRYQYQMAIELPHRLSGRARWWIMATFCQLIDALGLMYTAALHRPGDHGDGRNTHFHLIFHDRPARRMHVAKQVEARTIERPEGPPGAETVMEWDFNVEVPAGHKKHANRRTRPFQHGKVDFVSQSKARTKSDSSGKNFFKWLRGKYADLVNVMLTTHGEQDHYDPQTYEEMEVGLSASAHLGPKQAALEAEGVATVRGSRNGIGRYQSLEDCLSTAWSMREREAGSVRAGTDRRVRERGKSGDANSGIVLALSAGREALEQEAAYADFSLKVLRLRGDAAESRAIQAEIAGDTAEAKRSTGQIVAIKARARRAKQHLSAMSEAAESSRAGVEEFEEEFGEQIKLIEKLDAEIEDCLADPLHKPEAILVAAAKAALERAEVRFPKNSTSKAGPDEPRSKLPVDTKVPPASMKAKKTTPDKIPLASLPAQPRTATSGVDSRGESRPPLAAQPIRVGPREPVVPPERVGIVRADGTIERSPAQSAASGPPPPALRARELTTPVPPASLPAPPAPAPMVPAPPLATVPDDAAREKLALQKAGRVRGLVYQTLMAGRTVELVDGGFDLPGIDLHADLGEITGNKMGNAVVQRVLEEAHGTQQSILKAVEQLIENAELAPIDEQGVFTPSLFGALEAAMVSLVAKVPRIEEAAARKIVTERQRVSVLLERLEEVASSAAMSNGVITSIAGAATDELHLLNAPAHRLTAMAAIENAIAHRKIAEASVEKDMVRAKRPGTEPPPIGANPEPSQKIALGEAFEYGTPEAAGARTTAEDEEWSRALNEACQYVREENVDIKVSVGRCSISPEALPPHLRWVLLRPRDEKELERRLSEIVDEQFGSLTSIMKAADRNKSREH